MYGKSPHNMLIMLRMVKIISVQSTGFGEIPFHWDNLWFWTEVMSLIPSVQSLNKMS